jgi:predicted RNase H-like HicB family nuclease
MATTYALIHEEDGVFGISFPDFPGCVSTGRTEEEALRKGAQALSFHVSGMVEDGDVLPVLRGLSELRASTEFREDAEGAIVALVSFDVPGRAVRLDIADLEGRLRTESDVDAVFHDEWVRGIFTLALSAIDVALSANPLTITGSVLIVPLVLTVIGDWREVAITGVVAFAVGLARRAAGRLRASSGLPARRHRRHCVRHRPVRAGHRPHRCGVRPPRRRGDPRRLRPC